MRPFIVSILIAGAISWALTDREPERQFAESMAATLQISQISR